MAGLAQISFPWETENVLFLIYSNLPDSGSSKFIFISGPPTCNCKAHLTAALPQLGLIITALSLLLCICCEMLPLLSTWICLNIYPFIPLKHGCHTLSSVLTHRLLRASLSSTSFIHLCLVSLLGFITSFYQYFNLSFYGSCTAALFQLQSQGVIMLSPLHKIFPPYQGILVQLFPFIDHPCGFTLNQLHQTI